MASDLFYHDALRALADAGVRFVVVGGVAVNLQGVPRFTADLDVAVAVGADIGRAARALGPLALQCRLPVTQEQLDDAATVASWIEERNLRAINFVDPSSPLRQVDLVIASPVPYDEIEATAATMEAGGLAIRVASIDVLIRMKDGTGRAQDASDIVALRRVREIERGDV